MLKKWPGNVFFVNIWRNKSSSPLLSYEYLCVDFQRRACAFADTNPCFWSDMKINETEDEQSNAKGELVGGKQIGA